MGCVGQVSAPLVTLRPHLVGAKAPVFNARRISPKDLQKRFLRFQTRFIVRSKSRLPDFAQEFKERSSANEVSKEIQRCYELVHNLGRGVVYLGSSRISQDHKYFSTALELGREIASLLKCTTWTGVGPGLMDAVVKGALEAKQRVGGFKIAKEAGEWSSSSTHAYLSSDTYITCRFFSARKHGLVDAAVRHSLTDLTAFIGLPGGIGTLDEIFEILTLVQLERIGSRYPVPFILMNYDGFYTKLIEFLHCCENEGTVLLGEINSLWRICDSNLEALDYLANFYNIPEGRRMYRQKK
eukprot:TRINITY_DN8252_c0_g2_i1.p1 TRINITY_DN8252_c0_g2~~TRINITY_DN8252_c0_g2_i1.p1  ORF type:complete len:297 (+),score=36.20 TRINITY_DN8252_c0_g2_i1:29-919(+)